VKLEDSGRTKENPLDVIRPILTNYKITPCVKSVLFICLVNDKIYSFIHCLNGFMNNTIVTVINGHHVQ
jgi:hypothetical protein